MNSTNSFPWNGNHLVLEEYKKENYYILDTGTNSNKAIVFFSSNGIYYPNSEEAFLKSINGSRHGYDWTNIAKNRKIRTTFSKIMFVRDIYKQWYITGISRNTDSIEKVAELITKQLAGYTITTCGSSADGYMAALMGSMLRAERIVINSAQFDINIMRNPGPIVEENKSNLERLKYYNIHDYIEGDHIIYFYPSDCLEDIEQYESVKNRLKYVFKIKSNHHGATIDSCCYPAFLTMNEATIEKLAVKFNGQIISRQVLRREIITTREYINYMIERGMRKTIRALFNM